MRNCEAFLIKLFLKVCGIKWWEGERDIAVDGIYLHGIGNWDNLYVNGRRSIKEGKIKQVIVKQYKSGEWYALVCVDKKFTMLERAIEKVIGLDMGVKFFLSDSDGRQIENPKFYRKTLKRIKAEQRNLSRKKRGSNNRKKQILRLAKLHQRLTNQRDDFLHKLSRFYVDTYDFISIEDLNIRGMTMNHHLAQSILDASWSKFYR